MLILASQNELPETQRIWGTGGWLPPESREALDWLTLALLAGWETSTVRLGDAVFEAMVGHESKRIVLACDPDQLGDEAVTHLAARSQNEQGLLIVARAGAAGGKWAALAGASRGGERDNGRSLRWLGPGAEKTWSCRKPLETHVLRLTAGTRPWAALDGVAVISARPFGRGTIATLGFHPSEARDQEGVATALLRHLLIFGARPPVACLDWKGTLVLRMDDPGACQHLYLREWKHSKLSAGQWDEVSNLLRQRNAQLSIGYVSGWVDDGDAAQTRLTVGRCDAERVPGGVHPSPLVKYIDAAGLLHDYNAEYRGIQSLSAAGLAEVELHGHTHIHPDRQAWLRAPDRYESAHWFRELGRASEPILDGLPLNEHPLARGIDMIRAFFGATPSTLICPGEEFTNPALEAALDLGLQLVGSYYLAIRERDRFCWTQHVCAPYLNQPDPAWFDSELPVVGYFHDRDLALEGINWLGSFLDRWAAAGAKRFISYGELAAALRPASGFGDRPRRSRADARWRSGQPSPSGGAGEPDQHPRGGPHRG